MASPLNIEVKGINFSNQGAGLMLLAIRDWAAAQTLPITLSVEAMNDYDRRAAYGTRQILRRAAGVNIGGAVRMMPARLRRRIGLVTDADIDAVLDASGFAYGDYWGAAKIRTRLHPVLRHEWRPLVLLPQALGPFENGDTRATFAPIVEKADLIFVRDRISLQHLESAFGRRDNVHLCPDFTIALAALHDERHAALAGRPAIVPNRMMLQGRSSAFRTLYLDLLAEAAIRADHRWGEPFILLHDVEQDRELAQSLLQRLGRTQVVADPRPQVVKGILAQAGIVIGSRFHALVGALSHGTPVIAFGWSHKYRELLNDFGCADHLVAVDDWAFATVADLIDRLATSERDMTRADQYRSHIAAMWTKVGEVLKCSP